MVMVTFAEYGAADAITMGIRTESRVFCGVLTILITNFLHC
jgi:hypothetical protein